MVIYSWFTHSKWWFSIVMLVYQRVHRWLRNIVETSKKQKRIEMLPSIFVLTAFWSHNPFPRSYSTRPKRNHGGCREFPHSGPCFFGVFHMNGWWDSKPNFPPSYPCRPVSNVSLSDQCPGNDQPGRRGFLRAPGKQRWTRCGHRSVLRLQPWADFQGDPWFIYDQSMMNLWFIWASRRQFISDSSMNRSGVDNGVSRIPSQWVHHI